MGLVKGGGRGGGNYQLLPDISLFPPNYRVVKSKIKMKWKGVMFLTMHFSRNR